MKKQLSWYVGLAALFAGLFATLNWIYGYAIAFQSETSDCFFMFGCEFLWEFLDHPGGLLCYVGRFLGQFYHYTWLGALIVSAAITCFCAVFYAVLKKLRATTHALHVLVPCLLLLALHASVTHLIHDTLGLIASCSAFLGYLSCRRLAARRAYALLATPAAYVLLGGYAWLFVAGVVAREWLDGPLRSGLPFKVGHLVLSIALPVVAGRGVFPISLRSALVYPIVFVPPTGDNAAHCTLAYVVGRVLTIVLFASVLLLPFWGRRPSATRPAAGSVRRRRAVLGAGLAVLLLALRHDPRLSTFVACRQLYQQKKWDAVLEEARDSTSRNALLRLMAASASHQKRGRLSQTDATATADILLHFMTNFALCQRGRLLDEMFSFPQVLGTRGLVLNFVGKSVRSAAEDDTARGMYNSDLYYEMGHVNAAFRHAYSHLSSQGRTYEALERMALCSMVNGGYEATVKYLNILERTLFHARFARRHRELVADPSALDRELGHRRRRLPTVEGPMHVTPIAPAIILLKTQPENRIAFDYLAAWCLLGKRLDDLCRDIERYRKAGYAAIPTHCQEALLLLAKRRGAASDLWGLEYDEATAARVETFFEDLSRHRAHEDLQERLETLYGDTYMFYYFFVEPPAAPRRSTPVGGPPTMGRQH